MLDGSEKMHQTETQEYRCLKCDFLFEVHTTPQDDWPECPVCNEETTKIVAWFETNIVPVTELFDTVIADLEIMALLP